MGEVILTWEGVTAPPPPQRLDKIQVFCSVILKVITFERRIQAKQVYGAELSVETLRVTLKIIQNFLETIIYWKQICN